jgi:sugar lactone lactonase YvrE
MVALASPLSAGTQNGIADRELGQFGLVDNMVDFGGPAALNFPTAVAIDHSVSPNRIYVVDTDNNRVLGYADETKLMNGSSADLVIGQADFFSAVANASSTANNLVEPVSATVDSAGNLYVADWGDSRVLEYDAPFSKCGGVFPCVNAGAQRVFGQKGSFSTGLCNLGLFSSGVTADSLCLPAGVAVDSAGNLYIADAANNRVLEYNTPTQSTGPGSNDTTPDMVFGQHGSFTSSSCSLPSPDSLCLQRVPRFMASIPFNVVLAVDSSDNLWIPDSDYQRVLEYDRPLALSGGMPGTPGHPGDTTADFAIGVGLNGERPAVDPCTQPGASTFCTPSAVALDAHGNVYVRDEDGSDDRLNYTRILGFDNPLIPSGASCPGCGDAVADFVFGQNGSFTSAGCTSTVDASTLSCKDPIALAIDNAGALFAADSGNNRLLKYDTPITEQVANLVLGQVDFAASLVNLLDAKSLDAPQGLAVDTSAPRNHLYVADRINNRVLGWLDAAGFSNGAPADLVIGQPDFSSTVFGFGLEPKTFSSPEGVAVDSKGNLYVADAGNNRVLEFPNPFAACPSFPCVLSQVEAPALIFGQGPPGNSDSCPGASADRLNFPTAVAVDRSGNVYVSDTGYNRVLKYYDPLAKSGGMPGKPGHRGDTTADLVIGQDATGRSFESCTCAAPLDGTGLCAPAGLALDKKGNLYVAEDHVLEYFRPALPPRNRPVAVGLPGDVTADAVFGVTNPACPAGPDCLFEANAIAIDPAGNVFIADTGNSRVLEYLDPTAGGGGTPGTPGARGDRTADLVLGQNGSFSTDTCNGSGQLFVADGAASAASLCFPSGLALDGLLNLYVSDNGNHRILAFAPVAGNLTVSPSTIDFGTVTENTTTPRSVTLKNVGSSKNGLAIGIAGESTSSPFAVKKECIGTLRPGRTCNVTVTFTPTDAMARTGTLVINDNSTATPHKVPLTGIGTSSH